MRLYQLKHARVSLPSLRAAVGYQLDRYIQQRPTQYLTGSLGTLQHSLFFEIAAEYSPFPSSYEASPRNLPARPWRGSACILDARLSYYPREREKVRNSCRMGGGRRTPAPLLSHILCLTALYGTTGRVRTVILLYAAAFIAHRGEEIRREQLYHN